MRILIGTLYCGENEFEQCKQSIDRQTHSAWEHFVVANRPNKEAHDTLYRTFMERAGEFDLFLKLDADMVFSSVDKLSEIVAYFGGDSGTLGVTIPVRDFFTDSLISGMHVYRSAVRWEADDEMLFVDGFPVSRERMRINCRELAPAADHCPDPSPFFAFHYGMHRGIKALASLRNPSRTGSARQYIYNIHQVVKHFQRRSDVRLGLAVLGAEMALAGELSAGDVNILDGDVRARCERFLSMSPDELKNEIHTRRLQTKVSQTRRKWFVLQHELRRAVPRGVRGE